MKTIKNLFSYFLSTFLLLINLSFAPTEPMHVDLAEVELVDRVVASELYDRIIEPRVEDWNKPECLAEKRIELIFVVAKESGFLIGDNVYSLIHILTKVVNGNNYFYDHLTPQARDLAKSVGNTFLGDYLMHSYLLGARKIINFQDRVPAEAWQAVFQLYLDMVILTKQNQTGIDQIVIDTERELKTSIKESIRRRVTPMMMKGYARVIVDHAPNYSLLSDFAKEVRADLGIEFAFFDIETLKLGIDQFIHHYSGSGSLPFSGEELGIRFYQAVQYFRRTLNIPKENMQHFASLVLFSVDGCDFYHDILSAATRKRLADGMLDPARYSLEIKLMAANIIANYDDASVQIWELLFREYRKAFETGHTAFRGSREGFVELRDGGANYIDLLGAIIRGTFEFGITKNMIKAYGMVFGRLPTDKRVARSLNEQGISLTPDLEGARENVLDLLDASKRNYLFGEKYAGMLSTSEVAAMDALETSDPARFRQLMNLLNNMVEGRLFSLQEAHQPENRETYRDCADETKEGRLERASLRTLDLPTLKELAHLREADPGKYRVKIAGLQRQAQKGMGIAILASALDPAVVDTTSMVTFEKAVRTDVGSFSFAHLSGRISDAEMRYIERLQKEGRFSELTVAMRDLNLKMTKDMVEGRGSKGRGRKGR